MQFNLMRAVCSSLLWRGMLLGKSPRDLQAESWSIQAGDFGLTALLRSGGKYICAPCWVDAHSQCSHRNAFQRIICPGKLSSQALVRSASLVCLIVLSTCNARRGFAQFGIPGLGGKSGQSNDQKANQLLHQHLPLVLDANNAYPTVPDQNMLGGPFHPKTLPITLDTLTKPLPPGDYVLPMTFFCSEYSVHRGGNGIAYQLGPAQGTAAKAISTLLWRGMLTGHKPQELQSVSWAIQGSVAYDKMPPKYRALVDQLIPEMKNQVNGQAFADIEDGFQGKVNKITKRISEGIGKGTGGFVHPDIKVDVELNQSFQRLGQVGRSALDGEKLNTIFTAAFPNDQAREQALYAGQGQQSAALPATNGPWSVKVPGVAYMRFMVHGGNLQGDNFMQIRILPSRTSQAQLDERPHLVLAGYEQNQQSTPSNPSLISLFNGSVNESAFSQCQAAAVNQQMCMAQAITVSGNTGYSIGAGAQAPIMAPTDPVQPVQPHSPSQKVCVKEALYEPTRLDKDSNGKPQKDVFGLCIYLAAVTDVNGSCGKAATVELPSDQKLNWVQTYQTNIDTEGCTTGVPHKDHCDKDKASGQDVKYYGPLYRPDGDPQPSPAGKNDLYIGGFAFNSWKEALKQQGNLQLLFRDMPTRGFDDSWFSGPTSAPYLKCRLPMNSEKAFCGWTFKTVQENPATPTNLEQPTAPPTSSPSSNTLDNNLRLVRYPSDDTDLNHFDYSPMIQITYGFRVDRGRGKLIVDPLYIGGQEVDQGGSISLGHLQTLAGRSPACTVGNPNVLDGPPLTFTPFPYDSH